MNLLLTIMFLLYYSAALAASEVNKLYYLLLFIIFQECSKNISCCTIRGRRVLFVYCVSVYRIEDEDESLLQYQYTRNDGKAYRPPKG